MWRDLSIDLTHAARLLRTPPAFITVATLAVGIGIVTGFFAIVHAVLLTPLAAHGDDVVRIWKHDRESASIARYPLSYAELRLWRERTQSFSALAAISYADTAEAAVMLRDEAISVRIAPVSPEFFAVMHGGAPLVGRWFTAAEEHDIAVMPAVISDAFWRRISGGDPALVGQRLLLPGGARAVLIVGVAPPSLSYPAGTDLWVPLVSYFTAGAGLVNVDVQSVRFANFHFLGRLAPGVTVPQALAELDVANRAVTAAHPNDLRPLPVVAEPLLEASLGTLQPLTLFLFAGAALVFLAAGGNAAALLLMRASVQARDVAMRLALGASQFRIARQTLAEAVLLGAASAAAGLLIAQLCLAAAQAVAVSEVPRLADARLDARVLGFCMGVTALWVVLFGTTPLWRRRRLESGQLASHLATRGPRSPVMLRAMVVGQITAAVLIAAAAGLLVRSLVHLSSIGRGFDTANLAVARVLLPESTYPSAVAREQAISRLLPHLRALPGVVDATTVHLVPGTGQTGLSARMRFEGQDEATARSNPYGTWEPVVPSFFDTLGVPVIKGRALTDADDSRASPVAVVSASVAARYWPGQDPIGKRLQFAPPFPWTTVVGVVADTRYRELTREWLTVYFPARQFFFFSPGAIVVRTTGDPTPLFADLRRTIRQADPATAVHAIETMEAALARETARPRAAAAIAALYSAIAVFLAAVGVYGVFSYDVSQRTRELALRAALGAGPARIVRLVLRQSLALSAAGTLLGLGGAAMLTRSLSSLLVGVTPLDGVAFLTAGVGLLGIVLLASLLPARRAARVDPATVLRAQ